MLLADHILFFLLAVVIPVVLFVTGRKRHRSARVVRFPERIKIALYYGNGSLLMGLAVAVFIVNYFGGRDLRTLGFTWGEMPYDGWSAGLLVGFLTYYGIDLYNEVRSGEHRDETRDTFRKLGFLPENGRQFLHFLFLAVCAGVGEEIVYRGFLITYLSEVLPVAPWRPFLSVLLPAVAFGLAHFYQGGRAVVKIIAMAILFGFFFYRTGSLYVLFLLHTLVDVVGGLMSWWLLGRTSAL